jgi:hypothetical protein
MTDAEWLACDRPEPMLRHLYAVRLHRGKSGQRKLRLFGCAYVRRKWRRATDPRSRALVVATERYADGLVKASELTEAELAALEAREGGAKGLFVVGAGVQAPPWCLHTIEGLSDHRHPQPAWAFALAATLMPRVVQATAAHGPEDKAQTSLVRDVFGNPFRPTTLTPAHRTPTIVSLARTAYDERQFPSGGLEPHRLAVLADAVDEAGAADELVAHLRSPGPHVRGCHVVDMVLGRT